MKNDFQSTGAIAFGRGKDSNVWKSIEIDYAERLATASRFQKWKIKFQMRREFLRRRKDGHEPSTKTLSQLNSLPP
jgi:hypothetical protein